MSLIYIYIESEIEMSSRHIVYGLYVKQDFPLILNAIFCYKLEGRVFDSRWGNWDIFIDLILPAAL
jgi:hypothetical protein